MARQERPRMELTSQPRLENHSTSWRRCRTNPLHRQCGAEDFSYAGANVDRGLRADGFTFLAGSGIRRAPADFRRDGPGNGFLDVSVPGLGDAAWRAVARGDSQGFAARNVKLFLGVDDGRPRILRQVHSDHVVGQWWKATCGIADVRQLQSDTEFRDTGHVVDVSAAGRPAANRFGDTVGSIADAWRWWPHVSQG